LRELANRYGFLLILDEVKTGFRASLGGYQALAGVTADLCTFGKAFANGFPIAALAGKAAFVDLAVSADSAKRVLIAGTYNCHPVPVAAAIACLQKLMNPNLKVYQRLEQLGQKLEAGQRELFNRYQIPVVISRIGSASCVYFANKMPRDWWDVLEFHDAAFDLKYRRSLIERGVYHFPVMAKQGSISFAHSDADIERTLEATDCVLRDLTAKR
jgi:glutamate-1-semialdehyde 2,1-aminomutase